jgi:hypothetical protein
MEAKHALEHPPGAVAYFAVEGGGRVYVIPKLRETDYAAARRVIKESKVDPSRMVTLRTLR